MSTWDLDVKFEAQEQLGDTSAMGHLHRGEHSEDLIGDVAGVFGVGAYNDLKVRPQMRDEAGEPCPDLRLRRGWSWPRYFMKKPSSRIHTSFMEAIR